MINRSDKKAFYGVPSDAGEAVFTRLKFFTELSISKNPKEYTRQYIDERTEISDVVGYSPSLSYSFDDTEGDAVLEDIVTITNEEKLGIEAHREIIQVDFTKPSGDGFEAIKRKFAVIADSEGDSTDAYTYSGTFKAVGEKVSGIAVIEAPAGGNKDTVEKITFTEAVSSGE